MANERRAELQKFQKSTYTVGNHHSSSYYIDYGLFPKVQLIPGLFRWKSNVTFQIQEKSRNIIVEKISRVYWQ